MICYKCKVEKPLEQFSKKKNGFKKHCKLCHNQIEKERRNKNLEHFRLNGRKRMNKFRKTEHFKIYIKAYKNNKYNTDINYKISTNVRNRIIKVLKGKSKSKPSLELLGCSPEFLWKYLESKFKSGMTKENYGRIWDIDHILPCDSFDLSKKEEQLKCFNYTNLQPLWKTTEISRKFGDMESIGNYNKGNKILDNLTKKI